MIKLRYPLIGLVASITALALIGGDDEPVASSKHYCEMVEIHKDTNGEYGWPAYRGESECPKPLK